MSHDKLHVIAVISNPLNFKSRYQLYRQFERYMKNAINVVLWTAELAIGDQEFAITQSDNPYHFQFRTNDILWHKENLINMVIKRLPKGCKYLSPTDADIIYADPNFATKIIEKLKQFPVVQTFSEVQDLLPDCSCTPTKGPSFTYRVLNGMYVPGKSYGSVGAPGFAWAFTREAYDLMGGIPDFPILGSADFFMASSFFGYLGDSIFKELEKKGSKIVIPAEEALPEYQEKLYAWQANALEKVGGQVSYVPGLILHYWHGRRSARGYRTRNSYLIDAEYVVSRDIYYREDGLIEFTDANPTLRTGILEYFVTRDEDSLII